MHIGFFKSNKDLGFINPKGKTSIHSSDINIEDISWAIYLHTLIEPITHFPDLSLALQTPPHDLYSSWNTFLSLERLPKFLLRFSHSKFQGTLDGVPRKKWFA